MDTLASTRTFARRARAVGLIAVAAIVVAAAASNYLRPAVSPQADARGPYLVPAAQVGRGTVPLLPVSSPTPTKRTAGFIKSGALSVLIEQFGGLNDQPPMRLIAFARIKDAGVISKLVGQLNALPAPPGLISCPFDDGSYVLLTFTYATGDSTPVKVDASGCGYVYVGGAAEPAAWTTTSPALPNLLSALVAHPPGSY